MADREVTINWNGKMVRAVAVPIDSINEMQSHYQLSDGTSLSMRTVVAQVLRIKDAFNQEGDPVYVVKSHNFVSSISPEQLRHRKGNP